MHKNCFKRFCSHYSAHGLALCLMVALCGSFAGCDPKDEEEASCGNAKLDEGEVCDASMGTEVVVTKIDGTQFTGYTNDEATRLCETLFGFTKTNEEFNAYFKEKYGKEFSYKGVMTCNNSCDGVGEVWCKSCEAHTHVWCPISIDGNLDENDYFMMVGMEGRAENPGPNWTQEMEEFADMRTCYCSGGEAMNCGKENKDPCGSGEVVCPDNIHYHIYDGNCEENTVENCGAHGRNCAIEHGMPVCIDCDNADCTMASCGVLSCEEGYVISENCTSSSCGEPGEHTCVELTCKENEHIYMGACEPDSVENCGAHDRTCTVEHGTPNCVNKTCGVESCDEGYAPNFGHCDEKDAVCDFDAHPYQGACEPDDAENCGEHGAKCEGITNGFPICSRKDCYVECNAGYHKYEDGNTIVCEADSLEHCGSHDYNCENVLSNIEIGTGNSKCESGACIALRCQAGYHVDKRGRCEKDATECQQDYHFYNNGCEPDDDENCGEHGKLCRDDHGFNVCWERACMSTSCESGYHVPLYKDEGFISEPIRYCVKDCESGSHWDIDENKCVKDDFENCGEYRKNCKELGMTDGECKAGKCVATSCGTRYILKDGKCEMCQKGYHVYNGTCEKDSINNCGVHGDDCTKKLDVNGSVQSVNCRELPQEYTEASAICVAYSCSEGYYKELTSILGEPYVTGCTDCKDSGYHIYNDTCERDTIMNCGVHGNDCSQLPGVKETTCLKVPLVEAMCLVRTCEDGYHGYVSEIYGTNPFFAQALQMLGYSYTECKKN
ncbi:MAG: hypothetical protein IKY83_09330 [Proteobacteria bacterium]|nr:hypothetical protein [Pseudomonadota bacterium]